MKQERLFKCRGKGATLAFLLSSAGVAALTLSSSDVDTCSFCPNFVKAGYHAVDRSSRAFYTIAINVIDYKYSLRDLTFDSDDYRRTLAEIHIRSAKRILELCEANKGFYVKAGQFIASIRQVPKEYSSILSILQDKAVPCRFESIKEVLEMNLGKDLSDIFASFEEEPIASASIAQVHQARLKDYQQVAVKVQYPGLEQQMKMDITTMALLSNFVAWIFPEYRFGWMVAEFRKAISLELDFVQEANNSLRTSWNFREKRVVKVPNVFWNLTTKQVLTMEFITGHKVDNLEFLKEKRISSQQVAKALMEVFAEMIFVHGFVHGDPHPGNILVSDEGGHGFCLVILDHGIYKELDNNFRLDYCQLWKALILRDQNKIQHLGEKFGVRKYARYFPVIFTGRTIDSKSALGGGMSTEEKKDLKKELSSLKMEDVSQFMESLPQDFLTILRTDGLLRSIVSKLGASQRTRMLAYAKYAVHGLTMQSIAESDSRAEFSRLRTSLSYVQLRAFLEILDLLSWMESLRRTLLKVFMKKVSRILHFVQGSFSSSNL